MRVVVLASYADSLINFRSLMLKAIIDNGHEVIALAPKISPKTRNQLHKLGVSSHSISLQRTGMNLYKDLRDYRSLLQLLRELQPDKILSYTVKPVIYGSLAAATARVPEIYSMITGLGYSFMGRSLKDKIIGRGVRLLYRLAIRKNHKVFFQNLDDRDLFYKLKLLKTISQSIIINGSGVDTEHYKPVSLPVPPVFLLVARLLRDKGIEEYVAASSYLKRKHPEARFLLVGMYDSHPSAINKEDIDCWQIDHGIEYLGFFEDIRGVIGQSNVYVLPSYREGTPRSVLEAMSMGRPVVTTDAPGCRETVDDGVNGFLGPVKECEGLKIKMEKLLLSRSLREQMGKESRRLAIKKYDVHKVNQKILRNMGL
jgi:glycosyltransferase involved in cell wall biosynthesis